MLNFAVGPVMMGQDILEISAEQIPYFRTEKFSAMMRQNEYLVCKLLHAPQKSRVAFITGSGTASMEASVINTLTVNDKVLIVNGGTFGTRFCEICDVYAIPYEAILCEPGQTLKAEQLLQYENKGFTAFLVNLCETSTGVLYDIHLISQFCERNNLFLIVDAVSAFLCDHIDMTDHGIDVVITGSQKALALAPGLSLLCFNERALNRIKSDRVTSYYLDLNKYLKDGERGQTPFTPAVGVLLQLNRRLDTIDKNGGTEEEISKAKHKAAYFRKAIKKLPLELFPQSPSNAVTALAVKDKNKSAYKLFELLMNEYGIWLCPNGGALKDRVFRVGHMGDLNDADYDKLTAALEKGLLSEKINNG